MRPGPYVTSLTIDTDGTIYAIDHNPGPLLALNTDGTEAWSVVSPGVFANVVSPPAIGPTDEVVILTNGSSENILALDGTNDGADLWSFTAASVPTAASSISRDGTVYVGIGSELHAFDLANGPDPQSDPPGDWRFTAGGSITAGAIIHADGTVYVGSDDGFLYALNPADGSEKWSYDAGSAIGSPPVLGPGDVIYFGSDDGTLHTVSTTDGSYIWDTDIGSEPNGSPAVDANGVIYIGSSAFDHHVRAINSDGTELWRYAINDASTDGSVYFPTLYGLYAFTSNASGLADTPWARDGGSNANLR